MRTRADSLIAMDGHARRRACRQGPSRTRSHRRARPSVPLLHRISLLLFVTASMPACDKGTPSTIDPPATPGTPTTYALLVSATGSGSVTSSPPGIDCGTDCTESYAAGAAVTLTAAADAGYTFVGWSGSGVDCAGTGPCPVAMNAARSVTATFEANTTSGVSYFVAPGGDDDANDGRSPSGPFRTIGKAVGVVNPGDVIEVRAGTYTESVTIRRPGSAGGWITMRSYNGERAVLRSTGSAPTIYFYHGECDEDAIGDGSGNTDCRRSYWALQGLEIQGSPNGGGDGNAIKIDMPKVKLVGNKICCSRADVVKLVRTSNDVEILGNEIWQDSAIVTPGTNAQGIDIVGADRVRVANNHVHDVPDIGIYAKGNARDAIFENNLLVNIGDADNGHALMLGQSTDAERLVDGTYETYDGIVRNNVVVNATWACLATASSQNVRMYNNSCYNTGTMVHGSVLISNESEVGQAGTLIEIKNNIIYGSANRPVIRMTSDAMTDYTTLAIDRNIYYVAGGDPRFTSDDNDLEDGPFAEWLTKYKGFSTRDDVSSVADPRFAATTGTAALTLQDSSPAIDAGLDSPIVPFDRLGATRPRGARTDIGAHER